MIEARRPLKLLLGVLLFLAVVYWPDLHLFATTGDVRLYEIYGRAALQKPIGLPREYPPLSAALFVIPRLLTPGWYLLGFALLAALAAWLTALAVERADGRGDRFLLYLLLGASGTLFFRYDIFVVLLTVLAFAAAARQRWLAAQALLVLGVALKLYPAVLMPLVVVWEWRSTRRLPLKSALGGALFLALALGILWRLAPLQVASVLQYQRDRPLEFESVGGSLAWLLGPTASVFVYGSWCLASALSAQLIGISTVLSVLLLLAVYLAFAGERFEPAAAWKLALVVTLLTNKVFSAQYLLWLLPFLTLAAGGEAEETTRGALERRLWVLVCLVTTVIYPLTFEPFAASAMEGYVAPGWLMTLVTLRNGLLLLAGTAAVLAHRGARKGSPGSGVKQDRPRPATAEPVGSRQ